MSQLFSTCVRQLLHCLQLHLSLQMHTFENVVTLLVLGSNRWWCHDGNQSLQSAACAGSPWCSAHYRYMHIWQWSSACIALPNSMVHCLPSTFDSYSVDEGTCCCYESWRFISDHKCPSLDHIVSKYNPVHIFITCSLRSILILGSHLYLCLQN